MKPDKIISSRTKSLPRMYTATPVIKPGNKISREVSVPEEEIPSKFGKVTLNFPIRDLRLLQYQAYGEGGGAGDGATVERIKQFCNEFTSREQIENIQDLTDFVWQLIRTVKDERN